MLFLTVTKGGDIPSNTEGEWGSSTPKIGTGKDSICLSSHLNWTFSKTRSLFLEDTKQNSIIKSRCLTDNKICSGYNTLLLEVGALGIQIDNRTNIKEIDATAQSPCVFPFYDKVNNKMYMSCTKEGCIENCNSGEFPRSWCAVSINNETKE